VRSMKALGVGSVKRSMWFRGSEVPKFAYTVPQNRGTSELRNLGTAGVFISRP
jgi:hypothetical protein